MAAALFTRRSPVLLGARLLATGGQSPDAIAKLHDELQKKMPTSYNPGKEGEIGKVLFTISNHYDLIEETEQDFKKLSELIGAYPKIKEMLFKVEADALPGILTESLKLRPETASMIRWIATENALNKFERIAANFSELVIEETGRLKAVIEVGLQDDEWVDFLKKYLTASYPGRKLQIEVRHDAALGPACRYKVGDVVHDDSIEPKFARLVDETFQKAHERLAAERNRTKTLKLQLPPNEEQKFWAAVFHPSNTDYDWDALEGAIDADGRVDWKKMPDPRSA